MRKTPILLLLSIGLRVASAQTPPLAAPAAPAKTGVEAPKVKLPRAVESKLANGLTVLILEDHRLPTISMTLDIRGAGGIYEPASMTGLAAATAQMLREGTATRTAKEIAETVDRLAAGIAASSAQGSLQTTMNFSGLTENFDRWFPLAVDILLHPGFPADEWNKLKQRQLIGLRQQRTSPTFLARERFNKAIYGGHPASIVSATPATLEAITPEALKKWHDERYAPQNA